MLELVDINLRLQNKVLADHLCLQLKQGETIAILGRSGIGKSTLLKIIAGLIQPDSGKVLWQGQDITQLTPEKRHFGYLFQDYALFPHLDVLHNVMFGLIEQKMKKSKAKAEARQMLDSMGLAQFEKRRVWTLSGGEQQRVALARAAVIRPQLFLLDEPFSALDADWKIELREMIKQYLCSTQTPSILVTHDRLEAETMADQIYQLRQGQLHAVNEQS